MTITEILRLFPAVIAPAIVAQIRRRWPALDGLLVWPVVVLVAVLLALAGAFLAGPLTASSAAQAVREGLALGLAAIGLHYLARGKNAPTKPEPLAPGQVRVTTPPGAAVTVEAQLEGPEPSTAWGPRPSS